MKTKAAPTGALIGFAGALVWAAAVLLLLLLMIAGAALGPPPPTLCGPGGTGQMVGAVALDAEQMANAQTVVSVTARRGLPAYAATVALATVAAESMFHNYLTSRDADSLGLFQQRVRYYTAPVAADPARSTNAFLDRLLTTSGWATRPLTDVAADVQMPRGDLRGAYAKWQPLGAALTARLWPRATATIPMSTPAPGSTPRSTPTTPTARRRARDTGKRPSATRGPGPADPCGVVGPGFTFLASGSAAIPPGLAPTGSPAGNRAAAFALAQLGKPYLWGSTGPSSWDCSSLVQAGWAFAGVAIARTTFAQVNDGTPVDLASARSGDLVFIAGSDGTAGSPEHVGMVAGRAGGSIYLVAAPRAGEVVSTSLVAGWGSQIVSVRRIG